MPNSNDLSQGLTPDAFQRLKGMIFAASDLHDEGILEDDPGNMLEDIGRAWVKWSAEVRNRGRVASN